MSEDETDKDTARAKLVARANALPVTARRIAAGAGAIAAGWLLEQAGLPIGWLIGSLLFAALPSVAGVSFAIPDTLRRAGQLGAGFTVGLSFTPTVAGEILSLGWVMLSSCTATILVSIAISAMLSRLGGLDRGSAFFSAMPGGMAEMAGFADRFPIDPQLVSLAQSLRVISLVLLMPLLISIGKATPGGATDPPILGWGMTAICLVLAVSAAFGLDRMRMFNPWLLGGLGIGIAMGLRSEFAYQAPYLLRVAAQVAIGLALGARFRRNLFETLAVRMLIAIFVSTGLLILSGFVIALLVSPVVGTSTALLAIAPGGMAEMSLTAEILGLTPQVVTAWHILRILMVALLVGHLFRLYSRIAGLGPD